VIYIEHYVTSTQKTHIGECTNVCYNCRNAFIEECMMIFKFNKDNVKNFLALSIP
jgi:hypothetical protein